MMSWALLFLLGVCLTKAKIFHGEDLVSAVPLLTKSNIADISEGHWAIMFYVCPTFSEFSADLVLRPKTVLCVTKKSLSGNNLLRCAKPERPNYEVCICTAVANVSLVARINCHKTPSLCEKWVTMLPMYYFVIEKNVSPSSFSLFHLSRFSAFRPATNDVVTIFSVKPPNLPFFFRLTVSHLALAQIRMAG